MASPSPAASAAPTPVRDDDSNKAKPRRFLPEPVETTHKSSKNARTESTEDKPAETRKPRRFTPQPIEHSTKSSRNNSGTQNEAPKPRRFAPQVVEQSRSSSKDKLGKPGHIRFIPEPIETLHSSNRKSAGSRTSSVSSETTPKPPRKWAPELIDTAQRSRRAGNAGYGGSQDYKTEHGHHLHAREHRRHITGYKTPAEPDNDADGTTTETEKNGWLSPSDADIPAEARRPVSPYDGSPAPRLAALTQSRSHSFHVPELDTIDSSESEPEMDPLSRSSTSEHYSPITASESSFNNSYKHATRHRESVDESFTHYLLQLEAKKYQQRLQEQALAAFVNSDYHEPIQHFINDDEDSDDMEIDERPVTWSAFDEEEILQVIRRRESTTVPWEQLEMQRHAEKAEKERKAAKSSTNQQSQSPWWNPVAGGLTMYQQDAEITSMRDRARPPMLGRDLVFPRCPSPERARFDTTQRSGTISSISSLEGSKKPSEGGLWQAAKKPDTNPNPTTSPPTSPKSNVQGLWGGHCVRVLSNGAASALSPPPGPSGLMTPMVEPSTNPFEQSFAYTGGNTPRLRSSPKSSHAVRTPPTPPTDHPSANHHNKIDAIIHSSSCTEPSSPASPDPQFPAPFVTQVFPYPSLGYPPLAPPSPATPDPEFPDSFVTQVFNYLSLGYPSLARPFDAELSKISRIPVATLRKDDVKARSSPRGYIRLGSDFEGGGGEGEAHAGGDGDGSGDTDFDSVQCVRWVALKLYVREWARQERDMVPFEAAGGGNWGTGARRGSWAI